FGVDIGYRKIGYLFLVTDEADRRGFETRIALQRSLGADVRLITPADAQAMVPALRVDDGMAGPAEVTGGFARRARELGARIAEGVMVTGIDVTHGRATGVRTADGAV